MERTIKTRINILICCILLAGFLALGILHYGAYSGIIKDDIANISKLTSYSIYSSFTNELTKPIFVARTMANDSFLKTWLQREDVEEEGAHMQALTAYLEGLRSQYQYNTAFVVSAKTMKYYSFKGLNKVVSRADEHDVWYYEFLDLGQPYAIDVDTDEVNQNTLTVFINCRIVDGAGNLLGVTGVGLELKQVQQLLAFYENDFELRALMFDRNGLVQVSTDTGEIYHRNVFDMGVLGEKRREILNSTAVQTYAFQEGEQEGYYILQYFEELDWYLLVKKDARVLKSSRETQLVYDLIIYVAVSLGLLVLVERIIRKNDQTLRHMAKTDALTRLANRSGFNEQIECVMAQIKNGAGCWAFVLDIDNFKRLNDVHGHLAGDQVLARVAALGRDVFASGVLSRWGGDEFAGFLCGEEEEVLRLVRAFFVRIAQDGALIPYGVTVCLGITRAHSEDTAQTLLYRADRALYQAKENGKNQFVVIGKEQYAG